MPKVGWPTTGAVKFQNVSIRYADALPPVVRNLNFHIMSGQKVSTVNVILICRRYFTFEFIAKLNL